MEKIDRMVVSDRSFISGGWAGANGVGVIPFCAPENGGLHCSTVSEGPCIFVHSNFRSTKKKQP